MAPAGTTQRATRIQRENRERILDAALEVFSGHGFRGSTIDQIAAKAGMSKPNLLYYFRRKHDIYEAVLAHVLDIWLDPLRELDPAGDPLCEIKDYIRRKIEISRACPRESRLFANEVIQGAPRIRKLLDGELKRLVDEKAEVLDGWMRDGKLATVDPRHLIFSIWATTQHYADFDVQVRALLPEKDGDARFDDAAGFLETLYSEGLRPRR